MATPSTSRILVLVEPPTAYLRCIGRAAVERARDFKQLVLRLDSEGIRRFCLDLTECRLMDSTFSGTLAALATDLETGAGDSRARFVLVNPNERVRDLLDNLGILQLVEVLEGAAGAAEGAAQELPAGPQDRDATTQCCLDAHRFLMKVNPRNVAKFQDLTQALEAERGAVPSPAAKP